MKELNIKINGKEIRLNSSSTIEELIKERDIKGNMFVIEQNLEIVPKEKYGKTLIQNGDSIEIVGFFGGG